MKEHQMYPHNPNSAESILTNKLNNTSTAWIEGQCDRVLDAMNEYAQQELSAYKERLKLAIVNNGDFRPYTIIELIDTL